MHGLRGQSLGVVDYFQSDETRQDLSASTSQIELESRVNAAFNRMTQAVNRSIEAAREQVIHTIPTDEQERRDWKRAILPDSVATLQEMETFFHSFFSGVIALFSGLWSSMKKAVVWATKDITNFYRAACDGIMSIFSIFG